MESVDEVGRCTTSYLSAGPACLQCLVCVNKKLGNSQLQLSLVLLQHMTHVIQVTQFRTQQQQQQHAGVSELAIDRGVDTSVGWILEIGANTGSYQGRSQDSEL